MSRRRRSRCSPCSASATWCRLEDYVKDMQAISARLRPDGPATEDRRRIRRRWLSLNAAGDLSQLRGRSASRRPGRVLSAGRMNRPVGRRRRARMGWVCRTRTSTTRTSSSASSASKSPVPRGVHWFWWVIALVGAGGVPRALAAMKERSPSAAGDLRHPADVGGRAAGLRYVLDRGGRLPRAFAARRP